MRLNALLRNYNSVLLSHFAGLLAPFGGSIRPAHRCHYVGSDHGRFSVGKAAVNTRPFLFSGSAYVYLHQQKRAQRIALCPLTCTLFN